MIAPIIKVHPTAGTRWRIEDDADEDEVQEVDFTSHASTLCQVKESSERRVRHDVLWVYPVADVEDEDGEEDRAIHKTF